jgi:2-octaprenyl-6-methoxyphenol hydroxylase
MSMTPGNSIIVAGGGPAGLAAACLLRIAGLGVHCIEGPKVDKHNDARTVALMLPAIRLLTHIGVWPDALQRCAAALRKLRIVDDTGSLFAADPVTFSAGEIGADAFGWNIPVSMLIAALRARAGELGVDLHPGNVIRFQDGAEAAAVTLDTGNEMSARAVIAADGRSSVMRRTAGIATIDWSYEQTAIATSFDHSAEHHGLSIEFHKAAGPMTTVPMPGKRSSLVWMETHEKAAELLQLPDEAFARRLQIETHGDLGRISNPGPRGAFAMRGLTATRFAATRLYLVGEAAHVVPPIGAQGLNMSMRDAALAAQIIADAEDWGDDPGATKATSQYDEQRRRDVLPRQAVIHAMNSSLLSELAPLHTLRSIGLTAVSHIGPLRDRVVREGIAPSANLPRTMRA